MFIYEKRNIINENLQNSSSTIFSPTTETIDLSVDDDATINYSPTTETIDLSVDETQQGRLSEHDKASFITDRFKDISEEQSHKTNEILSDTLFENHTVVTTLYKFDMTVLKIQCLKPTCWLNDEVVNFYMCMLQARDTNLCIKYSSRVASYFFNSFLVKKLLDEKDAYDYKSVASWTKNINPFNMDKLFFPVNLGNYHWALAVVYMKEKCITYYDSLGYDGTKYMDGLMKWIVDEAKKRRVEIEEDKWSANRVDPPKQTNGYDCGVFLIMYADFLSDDLRITFEQKHMDLFRLKIASAIVHGELIHCT